MGWISDRFARSRGKWGEPMSPEVRRAPLRRIAAVIRRREGLFDHDHVELECGHQVLAYGEHRARCVPCLRAREGDAAAGTGAHEWRGPRQA